MIKTSSWECQRSVSTRGTTQIARQTKNVFKSSHIGPNRHACLSSCPKLPAGTAHALHPNGDSAKSVYWEVVTVPVIGERPDLDLNAVIYATDFSVCSQNAGLYAALLSRHFSATLMVAHAFTLSQAAMEVEVDRSLVSQQRKDLEPLLSLKALALSNGSFQAIPVLLEGDPKEVLPDLADRNSPSLIVLGTHGGGWVEREIIGSVAEGILRLDFLASSHRWSPRAVSGG